MFVEPIIWRIVSWKNISGGMSGFYHRQYVYDDLISTERLPLYIKILEERGIETFKAERMGTMSYVLENNLRPEPRPGAERLSSEKKNHKLDEYIDGGM